MGIGVRAFALCAVALGAPAHAQTITESWLEPRPSFARLSLDDPFGKSTLGASKFALPDTPRDGALRHFRKLGQDEDFQFSSFVASRAAQDAAQYRLYLGMGYTRSLTSFARVKGRTFYGAGTYDGVDPQGEALPDEVRASAHPLGAWLGSNWQLESKLFDRHSFFAGVDYRQQLDLPLTSLSAVMSRAGHLSVSQPERKIGFSTRSRFSLTPKLSLNVGLRYDERSIAPNAFAPPSSFDTNGFELRMERNGSRGRRTQLSYVWQESSDLLAGNRSGTIGQRLTKLRMDIPVVENRLSTGFELQYLDVAGAFDGDVNHDFVIGNLTFTGRDYSNDTRVSVGLNNLFGAREVITGTRLLSFIPPDGRSIRLDLARKL